jgi:hypothetical protein
MKRKEPQFKPAACFRCRHYQVTWDKHRPYGCRAHNFKSARNPSQVVFESSGIRCQLFQLKSTF